jgi:hypothetical protein
MQCRIWHEPMSHLASHVCESRLLVFEFSSFAVQEAEFFQSQARMLAQGFCHTILLSCQLTTHSENYLVISGRDAQQNELLVKVRACGT